MSTPAVSTNLTQPAATAEAAPLERDVLRRPMRRKVRTPLSAHGEPMVWLTGGALAIAVVMIVVLLGYIFFQGISTFWPSPVVQLTLRDGKKVLGEVTRSETFRPEEPFYAGLDSHLTQSVRQTITEAGGYADRELVRTGNFELSGTHFEWVNEVLIENQQTPEWALVLERLSWGRFYGMPAQFLVDGQVVADTPTSVWNEFQKHHPAVRHRWQQRRDLDAQIGRVNDRLEDGRLVLRGIELRDQKGSPEWKAQREQLDEVQARADKALAEIEPMINEIVRENARYQLVLSTVEGARAELALADVVRAYPANQLGFGGKLAVYLSRWWEFLTDDPREANSEGGVYPAIFGTVLMTLLMTLAVVPFGVLAALYLREYSRCGPIVTAVRIAINNLAGVPSIVFGVFGLGFFCYIVGGYIDRGPTSPWQKAPW
ncbi:MAG TPA: hypothetical protein VFI31_18930, partial [Pirellulales bacterium]|nr:hypothetical protein [Pirellulales bacterium]